MKIKVLEWPGNSPNLNSIENLWSMVKIRLKKLDCTTKTKLIKSVIHVWYYDKKIKEICKELILSMKKQVDLLLKAKDGHISY